jgi:two-component system chemotaxis sensor kinase CheA
MSATKWTDYVLLPAEVSDFERGYLKGIHRIALVFFWAHVPVFVGIAALAQTGPLQAFVLSTVVLTGPTLAYFTLPKHPRLLSVVYGVTAMCMGGILVHVGQGPVQIEMHFYFFVLLALLAVTANPMAIVAAAVTVAAHHALLFFVAPRSVFNYDAQIWVVAVHALFVVLESVAACFVARSFFDNVVGLDRIVRARTHELDVRNHDMRTVLDHVEEGLVTLDSTGQMGRERSLAFTRWFGTGAETSFVKVVRRLDPEFAQWFELGFEQVLADLLPIELTVEQLPRHLTLEARTMEARYHPIVDGAGALQQMLVVFKDITVELAQARIEAEQRDLTRVIEHLGRDRQGFLDFFDEAGSIVKLLAAGRGEDPVVEARLLHTLKGNAGLFGLLDLAHLCHEIETRAADLSAIAEGDRHSLATAWKGLESRVHLFVGGDQRDVVQVRRADFEDVVTVLHAGVPPLEVATTVESWGLDPVGARLDRLSVHAQSLARRLNKPGLRTNVPTTALRLDGDYWAPFWAALVHVVRNAVDHGIEPAAVRVALEKPDAGCVDLRASLEGDEFIIRVADDGAGVDWERVKERASERGMPCDTREDLTNALLADGFSTRDTVSGVSGRGVGLSAVKAEVDRRRGRMLVHSEARKGTAWEFHFPKSEMLANSATARPSRVPSALARIRRGGTAA